MASIKQSELKLIFTSTLIFLMALFIASCDSEEEELKITSGSSVTLTITASLPSTTRTTVAESAGSIQCTWESADVLYLVNPATGAVLGSLSNQSGEVINAEFTGTINNLTTGNYAVYYMGHGKTLSTGATADSVNISSQSGTLNSLSAYDVMYGSCQITVSGSEYFFNAGNVTMQKLYAFSHFALSTGATGITKITLSGTRVISSAKLALSSAIFTNQVEGVITINNPTSSGEFYVALIPITGIIPIFNAFKSSGNTFYYGSLASSNISAGDYYRVSDGVGVPVNQSSGTITLTAPAATDGTATLSGNVITVTPVAGRQVAGFTCSNGTLTDNYDNTYTLSGLTGDCTVTFYFVNTEKIPGLFSVSASTQVYFSSGNLEWIYDNENGSYFCFANNQWDVFSDGISTNVPGLPGKYNTNSNTDDGPRDLFCWATSGGSGTNENIRPPYSTLRTLDANDSYGPVPGLGNDIAGTNWDWGVYNNGTTTERTIYVNRQKTASAGSGWRTMTNSEWVYLLNGRANASSLLFRATVNDTQGLVVLPDNWVKGSLVYSSGFGVKYYTTNVIDLETWSTSYAPNGALFLPAASVRYGTINYIGTAGYYWSSTTSNDATHLDYACSTNFNETGFALSANLNRINGFSVRLVQDNP